jgi:hypothetical protein
MPSLICGGEKSLPSLRRLEAGQQFIDASFVTYGAETMDDGV